VVKSWWDCGDDVWGRVGRIAKTVCGAELVELWRCCVGQNWWKCEDGVWGRVVGTVKTVGGAEFVEL